MEKDINNGCIPVCPVEVKHPEMLLTLPERDRRLDTPTSCEYCENTEAFD